MSTSAKLCLWLRSTSKRSVLNDAVLGVDILSVVMKERCLCRLILPLYYIITFILLEYATSPRLPAGFLRDHSDFCVSDKAALSTK